MNKNVIGDKTTFAIEYSIVNAPTGAVIDATTGLLTWTPSTNQLGNQQFSVQVQQIKSTTA